MCGCPGVAENQHVFSAPNQGTRWSPQRNNSHTQNQTAQDQGSRSLSLPSSDSKGLLIEALGREHLFPSFTLQ